MRLLLDTQLLLWMAGETDRLSKAARQLIEPTENGLWFSTVSIWEIAIKRALDRPDFRVEPRRLREKLLTAGYAELLLRSEHCYALSTLPHLHRDPFDRMLIVQADVEQLTMVTTDHAMARYSGVVHV